MDIEDSAATGTQPPPFGQPGTGPVIRPWSVNDAADLPPMEGPVRIATDTDFAGIWEGTAIPIEAINHETRLLTPAVGHVRAVLTSGEIFEGRLYAVGNKQVWLDAELGRIGLIGDHLTRIDHITAEQAGSDKSLEDYAGLRPVRVRTAGGVFHGRIVDEDEEALTLITASGARLTLQRRSVVEVEDDRDVILKSIESKPKPAAAQAKKTQ